MTAPEPRQNAMFSQREHRRISLIRALVVLAIVGGLLFAGSRWALARFSDAGSGASGTWFAPYVDTTLTPVLHFEDPTEEPADNVVLGFIVADPTQRCDPSWGGYYTLDAAARALDLDRRIVRLRERGGDAAVSFGGALNDELAVACTDPAALAAAYGAVVDRYSLTAVDFDVEGAGLANHDANARRAAALVQLQRQHPDLQVWLTLPVDPQGLTADGRTLIDQALAAGVRFAGFNLMTMNYGGSRAAGVSMGDATIAAMNAGWQQLDAAYLAAGVPLNEDLWKMMGATPMIGQNDVAQDVFTQSDATAVLSFAERVGLGRLSFWSANRDVACGASSGDKRASNTCSGVGQDPLEFTHLFAAHATGHTATVAVSADGVPTAAASDTRADSLTRDDPRTSPYPLWRAAKAYDADAKVVWQGRVYQAKWWTQGDQPDAPVKHDWDTPWRYLGPVLDSDRTAVAAEDAVTDGTVTPWSAEKVFVAGDEVTYDGQVFRAKWWTQGDTPQQDPDQPYDHPWQYLGKAPSP